MFYFCVHLIIMVRFSFSFQTCWKYFLYCASWRENQHFSNHLFFLFLSLYPESRKGTDIFPFACRLNSHFCSLRFTSRRLRFYSIYYFYKSTEGRGFWILFHFQQAASVYLNLVTSHHHWCVDACFLSFSPAALECQQYGNAWWSDATASFNFRTLRTAQCPRYSIFCYMSVC